MKQEMRSDDVGNDNLMEKVTNLEADMTNVKGRVSGLEEWRKEHSKWKEDMTLAFHEHCIRDDETKKAILESLKTMTEAVESIKDLATKQDKRIDKNKFDLEMKIKDVEHKSDMDNIKQELKLMTKFSSWISQPYAKTIMVIATGIGTFILYKLGIQIPQ